MVGRIGFEKTTVFMGPWTRIIADLLLYNKYYGLQNFFWDFFEPRNRNFYVYLKNRISIFSIHHRSHVKVILLSMKCPIWGISEYIPPVIHIILFYWLLTYRMQICIIICICTFWQYLTKKSIKLRIWYSLLKYPRNLIRSCIFFILFCNFGYLLVFRYSYFDLFWCISSNVHG